MSSICFVLLLDFYIAKDYNDKITHQHQVYIINPIALYPINPFVMLMGCEIFIVLHKKSRKKITEKKTVKCPRYGSINVSFEKQIKNTQ